ncbi:GNAT family N-acetyltransferase [Pseudokineococcus basanitobsidens]|uniref:GNAT family N-acetyltransferase n=1 Tax=Pseudokineococcus basanitobsidens TaxID=1926649 RepID=UPI003BB79F99
MRRAVAADVPAVVALLADDPLGAGREDTGPGAVPGYLRAFAAVDADPCQELLVAEDDGEVVATLQVAHLAGLSRRGAVRTQLEAVRVARRHRSRGLGTALVRWVVEDARRRGSAVVQLTSHASRQDAHRFYARLGFTASHVGMKVEL